MSWFRKKKCDFCEMLHAQAEKVQEGLDALHTWAEGGQTPQRERVKQIEREADELRRIVIEELNQTFVTPFDREDIFSLSRAIDDVMDYADRTVDEMEIYEVSANRHIIEMIDILRKASHELKIRSASSKNIRISPWSMPPRPRLSKTKWRRPTTGPWQIFSKGRTRFTC